MDGYWYFVFIVDEILNLILRFCFGFGVFVDKFIVLYMDIDFVM